MFFRRHNITAAAAVMLGADTVKFARAVYAAKAARELLHAPVAFRLQTEVH